MSADIGVLLDTPTSVLMESHRRNIDATSGHGLHPGRANMNPLTERKPIPKHLRSAQPWLGSSSMNPCNTSADAGAPGGAGCLSRGFLEGFFPMKEH